jgi:hypothetical protein
MKARMLVDAEVEVVDHFDEEADKPVSNLEVLKTGEELDFDVFGYAERVVDGELQEDKNFMNIQFPKGDCVFGFSREWIEILENDEDE